MFWLNKTILLFFLYLKTPWRRGNKKKNESLGFCIIFFTTSSCVERSNLGRFSPSCCLGWGSTTTSWSFSCVGWLRTVFFLLFRSFLIRWFIFPLFLILWQNSFYFFYVILRGTGQSWAIFTILSSWLRQHGNVLVFFWCPLATNSLFFVSSLCVLWKKQKRG